MYIQLCGAENIVFQKENGNTFELLFIVKSLQKEQIGTNLYYYDPQSAGINLQKEQKAILTL